MRSYIVTTFGLGFVMISAVQLPLKSASQVRRAESEQLLEVVAVQIDDTDAVLSDANAVRIGSTQLWIAGAELRVERKDEQLGETFDGILEEEVALGVVLALVLVADALAFDE